MAAEDGAVVEQRENENQNNQDQAEERVESARAESTGSLKVEDRVQGAGAPMGLADAFRSRGWRSSTRPTATRTTTGTGRVNPRVRTVCV